MTTTESPPPATLTNEMIDALALKALNHEALTPAEWEMIFSHGRNADWLQAQALRMDRVLHGKATAGTAADREAARKAADKAAKALATEEPKLRDEITAIEAKITKLRDKATETARTVEQQKQAVEFLRTVVPESVRAAYDSKRRAVDLAFHRVPEIQSRLKAIAGVLALNVTSPKGREDALSHLSTHWPQDVRHALKSGDAEPWRDYCQGLRREQAELEQELAELKPQRDTAMAEAEALLDHYVE